MEKYPVKTYPVDMEKIKALAPRYPRHIRWSDEDNCYIGSLPDLCGDCCHGDTPEEVACELDISAELALEAKAKFGFPFPEPGSSCPEQNSHGPCSRAVDTAPLIHKPF